MPKMDHVQRVPSFHTDLPVHTPPLLALKPPPCSPHACIPFLRLQPFLPLKCMVGFQGHTSSTLIYHSSFPATDLLFPKNRLPGVDRPWNEVGSTCLVKEKQPQVPDIQSLLDEMLSPPQDPSCQSNSENQRRESKMLPTKISVVEKAFKARPGRLLWLLWGLSKKENTRVHRLQKIC